MTETKRALKVFLCHASPDKPKARELYAFLKKRGIRPWLDNEDLLPGQNWPVEIAKAIHDTDAIIICLSKNSIDRKGYVQKEIKFALDKALELSEERIFIIPARLDECEIPYSLSSYQWVNLFEESGHAKLLKSLKLRETQLKKASPNPLTTLSQLDNLNLPSENNLLTTVSNISTLEKPKNPITTRIISQVNEIEAGQIAIFKLDIANTGSLVASFDIAVEGVPQEWVNIVHQDIILTEGEHRNIIININPPRHSESKAGNYTVNINISSDNYLGNPAIMDIPLYIKPYYEFSLGNLLPREQNIAWQEPMSNTSLVITNIGNCPADFAVSAVDDENGCSFDFVVQDGLRLNRQATLHIPAGQTLVSPVEITPHRRPILVRRKRHAYTVTAQATNRPSTPQMVSGSLTIKPLFPWWLLVLSFYTLSTIFFFIMQPYIYAFNVVANKDVIELGDSTTLRWSVSPFASRVHISNIPEALTNGQTSLLITPNTSTTYELVAGNSLSSILNIDRRESRTVLVIPPAPSIKAFTVDNTTVAAGKRVRVSWSITEADQAFLTVGEIAYELPKEQFSGEREVLLNKDGLVILDAQNTSGHDLRSYFVNVVPPHIIITNFAVWVSSPDEDSTSRKSETAKLATSAQISPDPDYPYPYVGFVSDPTSSNGYRPLFYQKRKLDKGEQVLVVWDVDGTDNNKVQIIPFAYDLPSKGNMPFFPTESMNFILTTKSGELENIYMLPVRVSNKVIPQ